ncbi:MAG: hypothetical protein A2W08_00445 [Candidatus Rokubacteria bacterium RBG_16_73_20]|nr:MAG: hypothetical protein A2050_17495 [Candidatus Rokubacteria bacterium GWA2_73_35]OGK97452.1 MAG: hypothetical protein A2W08_00445 [Candidatus Rokubacteria bacterium RBG_16_73_20]HBH01685.1 hypothetical protein [Candidatus Rokubacteria bacterium]
MLGAGGYYATGTPQYSLYLLARGLQDRDETAVGAHFDTERVAEDAAALFWERARARLRLQFDEATLEARIDEIKPELDRLLRAGARPGIERLLAEALGPLAFPWGLVTTWQRAAVARDTDGAAVRVRGAAQREVELRMAPAPGRRWRVVAFDRDGVARMIETALE